MMAGAYLMGEGKVSLCECWARDGIQNWPERIPAESKAEIVNAVLSAGFAEAEVASLVPPRTTSQFDDALEVLQLLSRPDGVKTRVIVPNVRGLERALAANEATGAITTIGFPISASESHNRANLGRSREDSMMIARQIIKTALDEGFDVVGSVSTALGCPIEGIVHPEQVMAMVDELYDAGLRRMMLADSTGLADPVSAQRLYEGASARYPDVEWIAHFHDTRGRGMANTLAALAGGATMVDSCFGGIGGEPDSVAHGHVGEAGNVVTEDLVSMLAQMGTPLDVTPDRVVEIGRRVETIMGRQLRSQVLRSGPGLEARPTQATAGG
jgi:hydroxymethylglutaryl-CoA lyase